MSKRDPYPPLKLENDFTLSGYKPKQKRTNSKPTHMAQTEEPWSRLNDTDTWSSFRRSIMHCGTQAPRDSLDLHLKSVYDHHKDFFWSKNQILYQRDNVCDVHRKFKKRHEIAEQDQEIRRWVDPQRCSIYNIK